MSCIVWLTGPPAAGKTTIARALERELRRHGESPVLLDGDDMRTSPVSSDLGFDGESRRMQCLRAGWIAGLVADAGVPAIVALVSPRDADRRDAMRVADPCRCVLVHVDCPEAVRRARDPKGLYARQQRGEIAGLTGADAAYDAPEDADVALRTDETPVAECVAAILTASGWE